MMLAPFAAAAAAAGLLLHPASGQVGRTESAGCGKSGLVCRTVTVPLDRSGAVAGSVALHVDVLRNAGGPSRGVIFLVAGGPGQGSAEAFGLGNPEYATFFRLVFPGWTLVAYDDRGTGKSGPLECPALDVPDESDLSADQAASVVAGCADSIGPARDFYATADQVEDLDAVRQAVGADRIAIYGVSYGTKLALAYASAFPDRVQRLLLDSVVPVDRPDAFLTDELQAMPATLAHFCQTSSCRAVTPDYASDVIATANGLASAPIANAKAHLGAAEFLGLVFATDLQPGLAAALPAAVRAADDGDTGPLLRLDALASTDDAGSSAAISSALYLATTCHDGSFPWQPGASLADRDASLQAALAGTSGLLGPFGTWATDLGTASGCLGWPTPVAGAGTDPHPLPNVPVLALSGGLDLRAPTRWGASVVGQFPQGHLLVVPGVGHSVLTMDPSGCSQRAVLHWMFGATPPKSCPAAKPFLPTVPAYPSHAPARLDARGTRLLAEQTLEDAEAIWLLTAGSANAHLSAPGLGGGVLHARDESFVLQRYGVTPGLTLSGTVRLARDRAPLEFSGELTIGGTAAKHERVELKLNTLQP